MTASGGRQWAAWGLLAVAGGLTAVALTLAWARTPASWRARASTRVLRAGTSVLSWAIVRMDGEAPLGPLETTVVLQRPGSAPALPVSGVAKPSVSPLGARQTLPAALEAGPNRERTE